MYALLFEGQCKLLVLFSVACMYVLKIDHLVLDKHLGDLSLWKTNSLALQSLIVIRSSYKGGAL